MLSFLLPADEELLAAQAGVYVLRGRERTIAVRPLVLAVYREVVAQIGIGLVESKRTLRQAMARQGQASRWWFHPVSKRDPESEPQFEWILHVLIIRAMVEETGSTGVKLVGASEEVTEVLRSILTIEDAEQGGKAAGILSDVACAVGTRTFYLFKFIYYRFAMMRHYRLPKGRYDMVFSSFWDWAFSWDKKEHRYRDRYFQRLPSLLMNTKAEKVGYFAWFSPYSEPSQRGRSLARVLEPLRRNDDVVLLQALLTIWDVIRAMSDLKSFWILRKALRSKEFRQNFSFNGMDWWPVFRPVLKRGCLNVEMPHGELMALATERAARRYRPRLTLSFQEHLPHGRAHYEGMRRAKVGAENWAMQHAGVCPEKTFYFLHPKYEFRGEPDGCAVPHPDQVFVMGEFGRTCFLDCGYAPAQIKMSGSTRYDHVRIIEGETGRRVPGKNGLCILLACSLEIETEIALVEAAVLAVRGLTKITLRVRSHPFNKVDAHPRFAMMREAVEISGGSLQDDLNWADLVLFSYSTVAEEAFLQGKPCWQWLPLGFDGSALAKATPIPRFGSVAALRTAVQDFDYSAPSVAARNAAAMALFAPVDGQAAERIAACIRDVIRVAGVTNS
ncbi:MAG TPA: hypothetical protein VK717_06620 [Opitutaceae bacterium]|nr:hypothetical protein [Opitutaceae bacterium]